jgi:molecular chaperone GrpE
MELNYATKEKTAIQGLAKDFLLVADNLERARNVPSSTPSSELMSGIVRVEQHLHTVLGKHAVARLETSKGDTFDPNVHDAMLTVSEADSNLPAGTIADVIENGYVLHDRVIRAPRVVVVKGSSEESADTPPGA